MPSSEGPPRTKRVFYYSRLEKTLFPGYFVRRAFIKITNIDFGRAMKSVMTLSHERGARACPGRGWRSVNTEGDGTQSLWILIISSFLQSFTICRANYILLPELYTHRKIRSFVYFLEKTRLTFPLQVHLPGSVSFNLLIFIFLHRCHYPASLSSGPVRTSAGRV